MNTRRSLNGNWRTRPIYLLLKPPVILRFTRDCVLKVVHHLRRSLGLRVLGLRSLELEIPVLRIPELAMTRESAETLGLIDQAPLRQSSQLPHLSTSSSTMIKPFHNVRICNCEVLRMVVRMIDSDSIRVQSLHFWFHVSQLKPVSSRLYI